jgi:hypothetical protein
MMRALVVAASLALLIIGWFAFQDDRGVLGLSGDMTLQLVYLLMVLLLVSGAGYGFRRIRNQPGVAIAGALFWAGAAVVLVLLYRIFT